MQDRQARVEAALADTLPAAETLPTDLHRAMRYAVLDGGKRIRPLLVYAAGQAVGVDEALLDAPACAVELIHAYSLIHDDLPAMDDDDLRRGKPTVHKAFGEALAILAGDALQTLAFDVLARNAHTDLNAAQRVEMIASLTLASGSRGMVGGQAIDMAATGQRLDLPALEIMHIHKTGALIRASVRLGALCRAELPADALDALDHYAKCVGLAFQIRDDILDVEGDTATLGKTQGADLARDKPTYPALLGLDGAKQRAAELYQEALDSLGVLGEAAEPLRGIAGVIVERAH
ncbi:MAG TPA: farnesyl diphosphate synthase [Gammaproteobacteria bacterium]|nr:farnesyl diphosphate synthase [Gammaproteobacteria bacterium]